MRQVVLFIFFIVLVYACSRTCESDYSEPIKSPVDEIIKILSDVPTYSVILYDMNTEGSIFKEYYHQYKIISEENQRMRSQVDRVMQTALLDKEAYYLNKTEVHDRFVMYFLLQILLLRLN